MNALTLRRMTPPEIETLYATRLRADFPPDECKPLEAILSTVGQGVYDCLSAWDGDRFAGYALLRHTGGRMLLLDYFAVAAECRDQGYGSAILAQLKQRYRADGRFDGILLEVERIGSAQTQAQVTERTRRIAFYRRNGAVVSGVEGRVFGVDYTALYFSFAGQIPDETVKAEYAGLYRPLPPAVRQAQVKVWQAGE